MAAVEFEFGGSKTEMTHAFTSLFLFSCLIALMQKEMVVHN
jgi:hypothetical protein